MRVASSPVQSIGLRARLETLRVRRQLTDRATTCRLAADTRKKQLGEHLLGRHSLEIDFILAIERTTHVCCVMSPRMIAAHDRRRGRLSGDERRREESL